MIVTCPSCGARYRLSDDALGEIGRKVRCGTCGHVWFETARPGEQHPARQDEAPSSGAEAHADTVPEREPVAARPDDIRDDTRDDAPDDDAAGPGESEPAERPRRGWSRVGTAVLLLAITVALALVAAFHWRDEVIRAVPSAAIHYEWATTQLDRLETLLERIGR